MAEVSPQDGRSCCIIIPARFDSSRFPGKPLARLRGAVGEERTLVEWSWRAAKAVPEARQVLVATDDRRIAEEVERFGGTAVMTPAECANGTERCAAALEHIRHAGDIIVNLQGDAPLTPPSMVSALLERLESDPGLAVATPAVPSSEETRQHLLNDRASGRAGGTTAVFSARGDALYFSKEVIPFGSGVSAAPIHLHVGLYAYRREALGAYVAAPASQLELSEGLEQLRFLDLGMRVGVVVCPAPDGLMIELNNPGDGPFIERELGRRGS